MSWIPCPSCGKDLPSQPTRCPHCGLALTGPDAARLWQVDQSMAALRVERTLLLARLRAIAAPSDAPSVAPATATRGPAVMDDTTSAPGLAPMPAPAPLVSPSAPTSRRQGWTTQQTVLAVGVLLVLVAASIALAYAWFVIGRYGQVAVMAGFTALAAFTALHLSRRDLPSSAEALALVTGGLLLLDASAARRFGLAGLDALDGRAYAAGSGLLIALLLAALHRRDRRIAGFAVLSLTSASVGWAGVVAFADDWVPGMGALALLGAVLFATLHVAVPDTAGLTGRAATGPAAGWTVVAFGLAFIGAAEAGVDVGPTWSGLSSILLLAALAAAGIAAVRAVVAGRATQLGSRAAVRADWVTRPWSGDWRAVGVVALVTTASVPAAVLTLGLQLGPIWTATLSVLAALVAIGILAARPFGDSVGARWAEAQAGLSLGILVLVSLVHESEPASIVALTATALAATTCAVLRPPWRAAASGVAAAAAVGAVALTGGLASAGVQSVAVSLTGLALVAFALGRRATLEEAPLGLVGAIALSLALALAHADLADGIVITALSCITAAAVATAVLRRALRPAAAGVAATAGTWALWVAGAVVSPELQWTLVALAGATLLVLAAWRRGHHEEAVLATVGAVVAVTAVGFALDRSWVHTAAGAAAAYGLLAVGYAALPRRRAVVTAAVVGGTVAAWLELARADVTTLEAYTLPLAALLLAAGLWSHRELADVSWLTAGPAVAVALLPSALFTAVDDVPVRALLTVSVASAVLVVGAWRRWQALVVLGAAAAVVVALTQLGPYTVQLPRYLTLGTLGVALLAVGTRYEQRRANARRAMSWLASMT